MLLACASVSKMLAGGMKIHYNPITITYDNTIYTGRNRRAYRNCTKRRTITVTIMRGFLSQPSSHFGRGLSYQELDYREIS